MVQYSINKGINKAMEFRGLKGQYIYYLAVGLAVLLIAFTIMYIAGVPVYLCVPVVVLAGSGLFLLVYRYSNKYGEHGLSKALAYRQVPSAILFKSRSVLTKLNVKKEDDGDNDFSRSGFSRSAFTN